MPITTRVVSKYGTPEEREGAYYIGRGSPLGNPWPINDAIGDTREVVIQRFAEHLPTRPDLLELIKTLKGKKLMCFCAHGPNPKICHGDVCGIIAEGIETDPVKAGLIVTRDHKRLADFAAEVGGQKNGVNVLRRAVQIR